MTEEGRGVTGPRGLNEAVAPYLDEGMRTRRRARGNYESKADPTEKACTGRIVMQRAMRGETPRAQNGGGSRGRRRAIPKDHCCREGATT